MKKEEILIGHSDYSKEQIESGQTGYTLGSSQAQWMNTFSIFEQGGYRIESRTSLFRRLFCIFKYKVMAVK